MVIKCLLKFYNSNPHKNNVQELRTNLKNYQELSKTACELGDSEAYMAIQVLYRETFMELLAASFCASLYSLLPHILIIWLLSFKLGPIYLGNFHIGILIWYPVTIILSYFMFKKLKSLKNKITVEEEMLD